MKRLLDTDTFSYVLNGHEPIASHARAYIEQEGYLSISLITFYESLRGLKFTRAAGKLDNFERFARTNEIVTLDIPTCRVAADVHAVLRSLGSLLPDADLLIAATALARGYLLVTRNTRHFQRIPNLQMENWAD